MTNTKNIQTRSIQTTILPLTLRTYDRTPEHLSTQTQQATESLGRWSFGHLTLNFLRWMKAEEKRTRTPSSQQEHKRWSKPILEQKHREVFHPMIEQVPPQQRNNHNWEENNHYKAQSSQKSFHFFFERGGGMGVPLTKSLPTHPGWRISVCCLHDEDFFGQCSPSNQERPFTIFHPPEGFRHSFSKGK